MIMAIEKKDLIKLLDELGPEDLEKAYWSLKGITEHHDQSWYWTERWQHEEREVDAWKASGQRTGPMDPEEALAVLDRIVERGECQDE